MVRRGVREGVSTFDNTRISVQHKEETTASTIAPIIKGQRKKIIDVAKDEWIHTKGR